MKLTERKKCVIGGNADLEPLYSFENFPVFMGCVKQSPALDLRQDMSWCIIKESGLIQLQYLLPLEVLYPESHGAGAVGNLWQNHHESFAKFLNKFAPSSVLEIGGAHGILAQKYNDYSNIPWTILEPNPSPVEGCNARFIKGFFDDKFSLDSPIDTIVHSHVFEHIYEPIEFMRHLSGFMTQGQHLVFSIPNMQVMLERKYTNCINFEHTVFLTEPYVEHLLAEYGFRLVEKKYFLDDHSIFYAAMRDPSVSAIALPFDMYVRNKDVYLSYIEYHEKLIENINIRLEESVQPVYLFGAHVFAQYLIAFGLSTSRIVNLLDNDPNKQGLRLYGTDLLVQSPKVLRDIERPIVILKAGVYNQEIKDDILVNINPDTVFLE